MSHLCLLLFTISVFSTFLVPSLSQSCGLGLKAAAVDNGEATNLHNNYRNLLNQGKVPNQPKAKHLNNLKLDNALAQEALKIARTCQYGHVKVQDSRFYVGQNIYKSCATVPPGPEAGYGGAVGAWYNEYKVYHYPDSSNDQTGHYTQLMWQDTQYVGCAYSQWEEMRGDRRWACKYVVCNYGPGGNYVGQAPYERA